MVPCKTSFLAPTQPELTRRDLIRERTRAGSAAAAARGRTAGRRPVVTEDKLKRADAGRQRVTVWEAATQLRVGEVELYAAPSAGAATG